MFVQHEAIMKFPSKEFYDDSLRIASEGQRKRSELSVWASGSNPTKFIDVIGVERSRPVATQHSSQQSKYNMEEVKEAVSCIFYLARSANLPKGYLFYLR